MAVRAKAFRILDYTCGKFAFTTIAATLANMLCRRWICLFSYKVLKPKVSCPYRVIAMAVHQGF